MPYFECSECGQMLNVVGVERSSVHQECPVCEEMTEWSLAFVDEDQGVSF